MINNGQFEGIHNKGRMPPSQWRGCMGDLFEFLDFVWLARRGDNNNFIAVVVIELVATAGKVLYVL